VLTSFSLLAGRRGVPQDHHRLHYPHEQLVNRVNAVAIVKRYPTSLTAFAVRLVSGAVEEERQQCSRAVSIDIMYFTSCISSYVANSFRWSSYLLPFHSCFMRSRAGGRCSGSGNRAAARQ
jgi:hypothetical protein